MTPMIPMIPASSMFGSSQSTYRSRREISRSPVDRVGNSKREAHGETVPDTAPPPYTEASEEGHSTSPLFNSTPTPKKHNHPSAGPYPLLTRLVRKETHFHSILTIYLVEIIAVTFSASFPELQAATARSWPSWHSWTSTFDAESSSVLREHDRPILSELCALV
jgi:hypothetical protein